MSFERVIKETGLSRLELAKIYGVSRQTIHQWTVGAGPRPGSYTARMAIVITTALLIAVEHRILPLLPLDKQVRRRRVATMVSRMQGIKPAPIARLESAA